MNSNLKKLFLLNSVFLSITGYSTIFISYFFWKNSSTLGPLIAFNGLSYFLSCFAYTIGTYYLYKNKLQISYYLSAVSAILLFIVLLLSNHLGHLVLLIVSAACFGCVFGFFYSSCNYALSVLSTREELNVFNSRIGYVKNILLIVLPLINSFLIYYFSFTVSFCVMLVISIFYFVAVTRLPSIEAEFNSSFARDYQKVKVSKQMVPFGIITAGVLECLACLQVIILVILSKNALYVSYLNILNIVILTIGIVYISKLKKLKLETQYVIYTLISMAFILLAGFAHIKPLYFVAMIGLVISVYVYGYTMDNTFFRYLNGMKKEDQIVILLKREYLITLGRSIMYLALYLFVQSIHSPYLPYLSLGVILVLIYSLYKFRKFDHENQPLRMTS
ncbi:hypothetical protein PU629_10085 [Pullulanibacillus sp. KACC 23026]|uniref:hypothetical protein n=1 Tax=Pullulanibacillus sp. KACC 23026 TaxID=3028315 RepID=UPI0023B178BA|nr:hypothetical protein [Pullulanibacillus sp. KACC 23026]WEG14663.1 hypothetical protein PU629_10085 [Pullulanibacillus sp. KACC 23026]